MTDRLSFTTDTSTFCMFDLESLKHRIEDAPDWWSIEKAEVEEVNKGNVLFVALGVDGTYDVEISQIDDNHSSNDSCIEVCLKFPTGRVFIGPGEDVTGGDLELNPEDTLGDFISVDPGDYSVVVRKKDVYTLTLYLKKINQCEGNQFKGSPELS